MSPNRLPDHGESARRRASSPCEPESKRHKSMFNEFCTPENRTKEWVIYQVNDGKINIGHHECIVSIGSIDYTKQANWQETWPGHHSSMGTDPFHQAYRLNCPPSQSCRATESEQRCWAKSGRARGRTNNDWGQNVNREPSRARHDGSWNVPSGLKDYDWAKTADIDHNYGTDIVPSPESVTRIFTLPSEQSNVRHISQHPPSREIHIAQSPCANEPRSQDVSERITHLEYLLRQEKQNFLNLARRLNTLENEYIDPGPDFDVLPQDKCPSYMSLKQSAARKIDDPVTRGPESTTQRTRTRTGIIRYSNTKPVLFRASPRATCDEILEGWKKRRGIEEKDGNLILWYAGRRVHGWSTVEAEVECGAGTIELEVRRDN